MISKLTRMVCLFSSIFLFVFLITFLPSYVFAVPSLGVATDGIYHVDPGDSFEDYQDYFASGYEIGGGEGFQIHNSGDDLIVFSNILERDIYLLLEADWAPNNPEFMETEFDPFLYDTKQADGYTARPYLFINLGEIDGDWEQLPADPFEPSPYYALRGSFTYDPVAPQFAYVFAAADADDNGILSFNSSPKITCTAESCTDPFSPKTSSARVPEPGTIILLGGGLIGLGILRNRIKRK